MYVADSCDQAAVPMRVSFNSDRKSRNRGVMSLDKC